MVLQWAQNKDVATYLDVLITQSDPLVLGPAYTRTINQWVGNCNILKEAFSD